MLHCNFKKISTEHFTKNDSLNFDKMLTELFTRQPVHKNAFPHPFISRRLAHATGDLTLGHMGIHRSWLAYYYEPAYIRSVLGLSKTYWKSLGVY